MRLAFGFCWLVCFGCCVSQEHLQIGPNVHPQYDIVPVNVTFLEVMLICVIVIESVTFLAAVTKYRAKRKITYRKKSLFWLTA